jgi:DNA-binding NtrC family response regulator
MFAPGIVIFEKTSRWEALLKRYFQDRGVQVRPCRLPAQVPSTLQQMPGSVTVIDLAAGSAQGLRLVAQAQQQIPPGKVIVIASESMSDLEWPAREFGAIAFLSDSVSEEQLGSLCARQLPVLSSPATSK